MKVFVRYVFTGAVLVVVLDAIYAALSLYSHIAYAWFTLPQMAFYAILAWIVTRNLANWRAGAATAFIVSIVEATLGWWVSALIGPGRPPERGAVMLVSGALFAIALSSIVGAISAGLTARHM
jgi:hypothetical protein